MNYKIESNIDFYAELNKELNDNNINSEKQHCLLSNNILEDNYITLDCSHSFNYLPLYNEICEQKNMYFEFDDARRIHKPYTDGYLRGKYIYILY